MMNLIVFVIVGAIAGFLADKVMTGHGLGLIWDIVVGILGAFVGGWLASTLFGIGTANLLVLGIVAFIGACILLFLFRLIFRRGMARA
ncbi:MAG: GlsB/YeaQ/YmgE family stress response membrane protein [Candidatus Dormibacteraceae bacterium]